VDFSSTDLSGCDFTGCDLRGARFESSLLLGTKFNSADLRGATFQHAQTGRTALGDKMVRVISFLVGMSILPPIALGVSIVTFQPTEGAAIDRGSAIIVALATTLFLMRGLRFWWIGAAGITGAMALDIVFFGLKSSPHIIRTAIGLSLIGGPCLVAILGERAVRGVSVGSILWACLGVYWLFEPDDLSSFYAALLFIATPCYALASSLYCRHRAETGTGGFQTVHDWRFRVRNLRGTSFRGANLTEADFRDAQLDAANFKDANTDGTIWQSPNVFDRPTSSEESPSRDTEREAPASNDAYRAWHDPGEIASEAARRVGLQWRAIYEAGAAVGALLAFALVVSIPGSSWSLITIAFASTLCIAVIVGVRNRSILEPKQLSTVLWIRKFHRVSGHRSLGWLGTRSLGKSSKRLQLLIEVAALGHGNVVTLGNSDVWATSNDLFQGSYAYPVLAAFVPIVGQLASLAWGGVGLSLQEIVPSVVTLGIGTALQMVIRRWRLTRTLTPKEYRQKTSAVLRTIRAAKREARNAVLRCPGQKGDHLWVDVVRFLADKIDIVVVTAEDRSKNLERELEWLAGIPTDCMVLVQVGDATLPSNMPQGAHLVRVPPRVGWWPLSGPCRDVSHAIARAAICHRFRTRE
jgi:hypothetical protein